MSNITDLINNSNIDNKIKQELLDIAIKAQNNNSTICSSNIISDIAKNFANKNSALIEASNIIPEVLMRKNCKIIDFLINSQVMGAYFWLVFAAAFGWILPFGTILKLFSNNPFNNCDYCMIGIMIAQLAYYRFLWTRLMP